MARRKNTEQWDWKWSHDGLSKRIASETRILRHVPARTVSSRKCVKSCIGNLCKWIQNWSAWRSSAEYLGLWLSISKSQINFCTWKTWDMKNKYGMTQTKDYTLTLFPDHIWNKALWIPFTKSRIRCLIHAQACVTLGNNGKLSLWLSDA